MRRFEASWVAVGLAALLLGGTACGPTFPECEKDEHCTKPKDPKLKPAGDRRDWCIKKKCEECAEDKHCKAEDGEECKANRCKVKEGWCKTDADCGRMFPNDTKKAVCRANACTPECSADFKCPEGQKCEKDKCIPDVQCSDTKPCPPGEMCKSGLCVKIKCTDDPKLCPKGTKCENGECVAVKDEVIECKLESVSFEYNEHTLTAAAQEVMKKNLDCAKQKGKAVFIESFCDERGTTEYNMALGVKRFSAAEKFLKAAGFDKTSTKSWGKEKAQSCKDDACWSKDRRCDFSFKD